MLNALFVESNGVYDKDPRVIKWDIERDAFKCKNGLPAIAHPPCKRWGRYWSGGPSVKVKKNKGDDDGCFAYSLWYVRTYGGVIEHPEASHAWKWFGLNKPPKSGGWIKADDYGGFTCCVEQGHYGHKARKATWLYLNNFKPIDLIWGKSEGKMQMEEGAHSKEEGKLWRSSPGYKPKPRLSAAERLATPVLFKELLISILDNSNAVR